MSDNQELAPQVSEALSLPGYSGYIPLMTALVVMALFFVFFAFAYRRGMLVVKNRKDTVLELLETRPLGGRQFLIVAQYHHQRFLLGVCPGKIDYLCALDGEAISADEADFAQQLAAKQGPQPGTERKGG